MGRPRTSSTLRPLPAAEQRERFDVIERRLDLIEAAIRSGDRSTADSLAHLVGRLVAYEAATGIAADAAKTRSTHTDLIEAQLLDVFRQMADDIRKLPALVAGAAAAHEAPPLRLVPRDDDEAA